MNDCRCCRRKLRHQLNQIHLYGVAARAARNIWQISGNGTRNVRVLGMLHIVTLILGGQITV